MTNIAKWRTEERKTQSKTFVAFARVLLVCVVLVLFRGSGPSGGWIQVDPGGFKWRLESDGFRWIQVGSNGFR